MSAMEEKFTLATAGETIRVLLVDDEPDFAELTGEFLDRHDPRIEAVTATRATEGLAILAEQPIDCIVSDYEMPGMDGIEFLEAVRADYGDIPFILYTGKGSEEIAAEAIEAGVDSYQQKETGTDQYSVLANHVRTYVERHQERARADRLEEEYALVAETASDAFWIYDLTAGTMKWDGLERFGYTTEFTDPDFEWWAERIHPHDRTRMRKLQDALEAGEDSAFDERDEDRGRFSSKYRFQRADGTYADCCGRGILLFRDGQPVKMVGTMADITKQQQHRQELRETEQKLEAVVETTPAAVYMWDLDGNCLLMNSHMKEILGLTGEDVVGRNMFDIAPEDQANEWHTNDQEAIERGEAIEKEEEVMIDGDSHIYLSILSPVTNKTGEPYATCGISTDITERKAHKWELEQQNKRLDEFASVVSHDLQNPLNVAQGQLALAREDCDSAHLDTVAQAHDRMRVLINDLLSLARNGNSVRDLKRIPLAGAVEDSWENVETGNATLQNNTDSVIQADRRRLQQMLENLLRNAVEHGGDDVTITVGDLADGFYVADDGPGIPEDEREAVFNFGHSSGNSSGVGLAIVRAVGEAHGWDIRITDNESGGTQLEITSIKKL